MNSFIRIKCLFFLLCQFQSFLRAFFSRLLIFCTTLSLACRCRMLVFLIRFNFIKSLSIFLMHLLCHQSIHHPWHFETLLCGLRHSTYVSSEHIWCVYIVLDLRQAHCIPCHRMSSLLLYLISLSLSFVTLQKICESLEVQRLLQFHYTYILAIRSWFFFFIDILKKQIENEHEKTTTRFERKEEKEEGDKKLDKTDASALFL